MNREIVGGGGASIYPLTGDVQSKAGNSTVTVVGIQGITVPPSFPTGGEVLTYDGPTNTLILEAPAPSVELQTNGVDNSTQALLNLAAGTNISLTEVAGTVTIDATALGTQRSATTTNANGSFWTWTDGFIEQFGVITIGPTTTNKNGGTITFPTTFPTAVISLQLEVLGFPRSGSTDLCEFIVGSNTGSGAVINGQCSVPTSGGGATFDQNIQVMWRAIGN